MMRGRYKYMKILIIKSVIDINDIKNLKSNHVITYNPNEPNIDLVIEENQIYFKNYKDFSVDYTNWMKTGIVSLSFIADSLQEIFSEISSMNF